SAAAAAAAAGWDADQIEILDRPGGGTAMIWLTVWDTEDDAAQFRSAAGAWLSTRHPGGGGWGAGSVGRPARLVWLIEGLDTDTGARVERELSEKLERSVALR